MKQQLKVHCQKEKLKDIRVFVEKILQKHGISDVEINKLVLAVDEVCANLMIHSHQCNPTKQIGVTVNVSPKEEIIFEITDFGEGFNICNYKEPSLEEIIKKQKKGGVGLILVKRIMDRIEFTRKSNLNICRLVKKFRVA